jgi:hypothetical protein
MPRVTVPRTSIRRLTFAKRGPAPRWPTCGRHAGVAQPRRWRPGRSARLCSPSMSQAIWRPRTRPCRLTVRSGHRAHPVALPPSRSPATPKRSTSRTTQPASEHTAHGGVATIGHSPGRRPARVRTRWWNCLSMAAISSKDVGVVEFKIVQDRRARPVVDEFRALVEEGGVVLVRLDHEEGRCPSGAPRRRKVHAAPRRSGYPGARPAASRIQASMAEVVVLPCVPATASTHLSLRTFS